MVDDDDNLPFSQGIKNSPILNYFTLSKIPKYDGKFNHAKHLNSFKTHISLRGDTPATKCRALHLSMSGAVEVWYTRLLERSIRSWSDFITAFLNTLSQAKKVKVRLQDMRFTDEITYCMQVIDREPLTVLRGGLDMNSFLWRDVQNKDLASYDALLEMIR